jgi:hypothetical protein
LQIGKIFSVVYVQAPTLKTAVSALNKTEIYFSNPSVFGEADFTASKTTEWLISSVPQTGTSLERQPTVEPAGSPWGFSVADVLAKGGLNKHKEYPLEIQPLNTSCFHGRHISLEEPTPKSVGHKDKDKDIFETLGKSVFEVSPKYTYCRFHAANEACHLKAVTRQL